MGSGLDWTPEGKRFLDNVSKVSGENKVSFDELFSAQFMKDNTSVKSLEELLIAGGFECETAEDFKNIPDSEWDDVIKKNTRFENWEEMQKAAGTEWIKNQLEF